MNTITILLNDVGVLFTAISVLAITVTGFFLGRRWLFKVAGEREFNYYRQARRDNGFTGSLSDYRKESAAREENAKHEFDDGF